MKRYLLNIAIAIDQLVNAIFNGEPDEMLSARAWRIRIKNRWLRIAIDTLFFFDKNHCQECYEIERKRHQLPEEYQQILGA